MDSVKEEQNRAREAGRSSRGGHVSGGKGELLYADIADFNFFSLGGRGGPTRGGIYIYHHRLAHSHLCLAQVVVVVELRYAVRVGAGGVCSIIRHTVRIFLVVEWIIRNHA